MNESNKKVCRQTTSFSDPTAKIFAHQLNSEDLMMWGVFVVEESIVIGKIRKIVHSSGRNKFHNDIHNATEVCVEGKHEGEDWRIVQLKSNDEVWICISKPRLSVHGLAVGK